MIDVPHVTPTTDEDIEESRLHELRKAMRWREVKKRDMEAFKQRYAPGTHGCHEALHVASIAGKFINDHLMSSPAVLLNPEWYRLASRADEALAVLYQAIGAVHLLADEPGSSKAEE